MRAGRGMASVVSEAHFGGGGLAKTQACDNVVQCVHEQGTTSRAPGPCCQCSQVHAAHREETPQGRLEGRSRHSVFRRDVLRLLEPSCQRRIRLVFVCLAQLGWSLSMMSCFTSFGRVASI